MPELGSNALAASMGRIVEHHGAAQRAAERAHDTHRQRPEPPETPAGVIPDPERNPAQTDRTPRS